MNEIAKGRKKVLKDCGKSSIIQEGKEGSIFREKERSIFHEKLKREKEKIELFSRHSYTYIRLLSTILLFYVNT